MTDRAGAGRRVDTMLLIVPIRTESEIRRTPVVNYALLSANVLVFLVFDGAIGGKALQVFEAQYLAFHSDAPTLYQFFTYQFLHADIWHLLGNMLFLWVFGNSVNGKMGDVPYLLFYLAGGVFAAWGYALVTPQATRLIGASGAIAAVTTAYLALFPRSRVTVLVWLFIFIHFFEVPAMLLILVKIIVWDNILAPGLDRHSAVAHSAHLAGYFFGFLAALGMLLIRALPRDQFDMLALWKRWRQRREMAAVMADPNVAAPGRFGSVGRARPIDPQQRALEERRFEQVSELRSRISQHMERDETAEAAELYGQLLVLDSKQCLSPRHQLAVARHFYGTGRFADAAAAFERYADCYPDSSDTAEVRLLLGIIYARDLRQYEFADRHLTKSMASLKDEARRGQCIEWLRDVRNALGRPAPEL